MRIGGIRLRRRPSVVAWGWRPGDIQLCSDEDWRRQVRLAREQRALEYFRRQSAAVARVGRAAAEAHRSLVEIGRIYGHAARRMSLAVARALARADEAHRRERGIRW